MTSHRINPAQTNPRRTIFLWLRSAVERDLAELPQTARILDYGCDEMPYAPIIRSLLPNASYEGADLAGNDRAIHAVAPNGALDLADGSFDAVISTQVLEHVPDPAFYLRECRRMLKPGGRLLITTHGNWRYHPHPHDYWRWTNAGLSKIIEEAGFDILRLQGIGNLASSGLLFLQDGLTHRIHHRLRPFYYFFMQRAVALANRLGGGHATSDAIVYAITAVARPH